MEEGEKGGRKEVREGEREKGMGKGGGRKDGEGRREKGWGREEGERNGGRKEWREKGMEGERG